MYKRQLLDYFPEDFLLFVDESHVTLPQVRGMYGGDRSRKQTLVDYGFRLPSALDNRPLNFDEFYNCLLYTSLADVFRGIDIAVFQKTEHSIKSFLYGTE